MGAATFPIGALLVPRDPGFPAVVMDLPGATGIGFWILWGGAFALMFGGMLLLRNEPFKRILVAQALAGVMVAAFTAVIPTDDPYAYAVYGRWQATGADPWNPPPLASSAPDAAIVNRIFATNPVASVYGPAFVGLEAALYRLAPGASESTWALIHRAIMFPMALAVTALIRGPRIAFWALNPLVMFEFSVCGHNDALMLACIAAAIRTPWPFVKGLATGFAGMIKFPALLSALFVRRSAASGAGTVVAVAGLLLAFPRAFSLHPLLSQNSYRIDSPRSAIEKLLGRVHVPHTDLLALIATIAIVALVLRLCTGRISARNGAAAGCLALFAISPVLHSWYLTWPLMCAPWVSRRLQTIVLVAGMLAWLLELGTFSPIPLHVSTIGFWLPTLALTAYLYRPPRRSTRTVPPAPVT